MLELMTSDSWLIKKREDFWIYQKEVNQPRANIENAPLDEHFKLEWRQLNKYDEEIGDRCSHGESSPKVAKRYDVEVISIEEKDLETHILLPLASSTRKPHSQADKRQAKKQMHDSPPRKKQYPSSTKKYSPPQSLGVPSVSQRLVTPMVQVCPSLPFSSPWIFSSGVPLVTMQTQIPTTLTLAPIRMLVDPQDAFMQASIPFVTPTFIHAIFSTQMYEETFISRRLGFGESSPPIIGVVSTSPFPLGASPFIPLFSPSALAHPIQTTFGGPISQFPFVVPHGISFVGQGIDNLDDFQQQVAHSKTICIGRNWKQKEKEGTYPTHPYLQTHSREEKDFPFFVNMFPRVDNPESQMRPNDYTLHAISINLLNATMSDKVEMMEETSKVVSSDFKKSRHLEKIQVENANL